MDLRDALPRLEDVSRPLTAVEMAEQMGMHRVAFARRFRREFGCSPRQWRTARRVRVAADRLARTDEPIALIAQSAGFADQSHLTRAFKRAVGLTPRQFRQRARDAR